MGWFNGILDDVNTKEIKEEKSGSFEALPQGNYNVQVDSVELKDTSAKTGKYIAVKLRVIEGEHKNRLIFDNWNIKNPSEQCQEIGLGRMKRVYQLAGLGDDIKAASPSSLKGKNFTVFLTIKMFNNKEQNNVASYDMPHDAPKGSKESELPSDWI